MAPVLYLNSIQDTTLWKHLNTYYTDKDGLVAKILASNLISICEEASNRMKSFPSLHNQYTLHDEVHLLRVTELMAQLISEKIIEELNPVEVALLILSAFFHDQGMILDNEEIKCLNVNPDFQLFKNNWIVEHPNLIEIRKLLLDNSLSITEKEKIRQAENEMLDALLTDYIRIKHGDRSANYIRNNYHDDKRWVVSGVNLYNLTALLCLSHTLPTTYLTALNGFNFDESVGNYLVNMPFLAVILRLADILDFDRDRTPDTLYRTIHFKNDISFLEWAKHRSVDGWIIQSDLIRFTMKCEHPIYERVARQFMDWIDDELSSANALFRMFPSYKLNSNIKLPLTVDRSRIEAKDNNYIYHDLEFSLSRDEVVKLLMTNNLYQTPSLCIRELLQNSLDALRHYKALLKRDLCVDWAKGKVIFKHYLDEYGYEIVSCIDNGVGMDEDIIIRFLTNVGKSYYRSPEFIKERVTFSSLDVDFEPCSQFGIGFMSCFMIGDNIKIQTRKYYSQERGIGKPLIVEINGLNGIVVIREGNDDQPVGTNIEIKGRKKPNYLDKWNDNVQLVEVLGGYAIACEFPIEAYCSIREIESSVAIQSNIAIPKTAMEINNLINYSTIEQKFSEVNPYLNGSIRASFLTNENGELTLSNSEASWSLPEKYNKPILMSAIGQKIEHYFHSDLGQTCLDGILVCGCPGKEKECRHLSWRANVIDIGEESFVLDIRGQIKPIITPARIPPERGREDKSWRRIQKIVNIAQGKLWEKVLFKFNKQIDLELFWQLTSIYDFWVPWLKADTIWNNISLPIVSENYIIQWKKISELGTVIPIENNKAFEFIDQNNSKITPYDNLIKWNSKSYGRDITSNINYTIIGMSTVKLIDKKILLDINKPFDCEIVPWEHTLHLSIGCIPLIPFSGEINSYVSVQLPFRCINRNHPLTELAYKTQYETGAREIDEFAKSAVLCLSDSDTLKFLNSENTQVGYLMHRLGHLYNSINWAEYEDELAPPYKVWVDGKGSIEISSKELEHWAKTSPLKE
ncbi:ATP-binding protein [Sedimentibacter sp. B4]|uniref:HD domain-containing protein n=1 Tax=Sedimentibacter sp. B4 TaxID=304766 RepID=UPI00031C352D|nr:ATP-binding protein [Sedimentibacter sp. B4]